MTSESIKTFSFRIIGGFCSLSAIAMARLKLNNCLKVLDGRKPFTICCYMWLELCVWCLMTYSSVYHGKIFDYNHIKPADFAEEVSKGGNTYYRLMFGNLNLTDLDADGQRRMQGKVKL